jgi:ubiquinone/menaquinone biosynthesis C-methylase UbiE
MVQHLQRTFWSLYGRFVWDAQKAPWKAGQVRRIVQALQARSAMPRERVLDAGCGTGDYALALARAGFQVTGIDYAAGMLSCARAKVPPELTGRLSFRPMDLNARLAFPDASFDHVINISVLQVTADPAFTLGELWRVLKPGGTLVLLHVPKPESHHRPLREVIRYRIGGLATGSLWKKALVAAKAWAERRRAARYWTVAELEQMLATSRFETLSVDPGPPILIVAERPKRIGAGV